MQVRIEAFFSRGILSVLIDYLTVYVGAILLMINFPLALHYCDQDVCQLGLKPFLAEESFLSDID